MRHALILMILLFSLPQAFGGDWARSEDDYIHVPGELNFYNRSACAKKALEPTRSVFLIVDNVNIAKSVFRLGKKLGKDTKTFTDLGIQKFRYSLATLLQITAARILNGSLPLIPLNQTNIDKDLKDALKRCEEDDCQDLYKILSENWQKSSVRKIESGQYSQCRVIKRFGTLHSHLNISKPDKTLLEEMAKELQKPQDYMQSCGDFSKIGEPEVGLYQFDLKVDPIQFKTMGFDFWNTLKIYLSWGFRNAPEMVQLAAPFDYLFKSAHLEEMLLLFSNGCASIKPTECSQKDLTLNNLSFLTQGTKDIEWNNFDMVKPIPETEPNNLFSKPLPLTENDLLNLGDFQSSDEWVQNFRNNFVHSRGYNKIKLTKALNTLKLITNNVDFASALTKVKRDAARSDDESLQQLYYLCAEYSMSSNKDLSLIRKDLWRLKDIKAFENVISDLSGKDLEQFWTYFESATVGVNKFCRELKQRDVWNDSFTLKKEGFAAWYRQLVYEKKFTFSEDVSVSRRVNDKPYLSLKTGEVICQDGIHCTRQVLDAMMSLSAISFSMSALVPNASGISSSNMGNAYASHLACGAYDPWAKRNKIIFDFAQDMVQAAVFGWLPTPVYVAASLDPKRVVSFETLVKEGQVYYDPKFNKNRLKLSVIADLSMVGVPCAVSISGSKQNPFEYYMFNGLSVNTCRERTRSDVVVGSGGDSVTTEQYRQVCATCAINLQTVTASVGSINPYVRMSFFLIKGVVRLLKQLQDPHDLARDWTIHPEKVALSYRRYGKITKECARKLINGKDCLNTTCEADATNKFVSQYQVSPTRTDFSCVNGTGRFEVKECAEPIFVNFNQVGDRKMRMHTECDLKKREL